MNVESRGISSGEAALRLERYGRNDLAPERESGALLTWLLRLLGDPMVILLAIAGITYGLLGDTFDAVVVAVALLPIFAVTGILEYRSDRALERLRTTAPPRARVARDGRAIAIPASHVVPGDVLLVREGDVIAADARLLEASRLLVDEAALTGESLPVEKSVAGSNAAELLAGTIVRSGRGAALVERTGGHTEYGRIARTLGRLTTQRTPIERSIHRIVFQIGIAVVAACALVVAVQRWHGDSWAVAAIAGISLAMAAIPEELPMVYTLYLALGAWRLAKDRALVRHLSSVETLGSTTVICVDKTGTLTYGRLAVESLIAAEGVLDSDVLVTAAMAADPNSGDPLDAAIFAANAGAVDMTQRELEVPFDPDRRYAAAIWRSAASHLLVTKGAYETLLPRCGSDGVDALTAFHDAATARGARVLAVARGTLAQADAKAAGTAPLQLVGLIAFADPVRTAAVQAIAECRAAGIRFVMITGDHPATARAIARACGLHAESVASGETDLRSWSDAQLQARIASIGVFARVRPEQKLRIVRALHAAGEIVAMTGDGTNDALALREADIGIAMGEGGTEIARAAADLVLLDDDVTTIVRAVADGRRIFGNLRHAFSYLVAFHAPLLLSAFLLPLLGAPILLLPIHLICLELIVHPTSALVFENDPPPSDLMSRPPRSPHAGLLRRDDWTRAIALGSVLALVVIVVFALAMRSGLSVDAARAAALVAMIAGQIALVFVERAGTRGIWAVGLRGNPAILPIVGGTAAALALAILWTPLGEALHLHTIPPVVALIACAAGCAAVLWMQPLYAVGRLRSPLL
jgi:P-type Ca2+ transporter type 2C